MKNQPGTSQSPSRANQRPKGHSTAHDARTVWTRLDSNQRPSQDVPGRSEARSAAQIDGDDRPAPLETATLLTLEDRLLVALAARGNRGINAFIGDALRSDFCSFAAADAMTSWMPEQEFVEVLERYAFEGRVAEHAE